GVCNAVAYAHSRGVLHRDLKPPNVVLGDFGEVMVLDWGLAKVVGRPGGGRDAAAEASLDLAPEGPPDLTVQGRVRGTPAYMAPEQAAGQIHLLDRPTDVYGLGAILYEILTGRVPFSGADSQEVLRKVKQEEPPPPRQRCPDVPRPLEAVCLRAMAKDPARRYASAADLAGDLKRWLADEPVSAHRETFPEGLARRGARGQAARAGAAP